MTVAAETTRAASAEEVLSLLGRLVRPLDVERVPLAAAAGRTLREPVCAPEDQPPFDRSSVDGYAVRLDDPATRFRVVDEIRAGDWKPRALQPGEAVRIATGAALPGEGLRVVMQEGTRREGGEVLVLRRDTARNIRFRGEDARAGRVLVEAGTVLGAGALALLASAGCVQPLVTRLPCVLHVATGNEIVPPEQAPTRGQIRDSNSTLVSAFFAGWGVAPEQRRVGEDATSLASGIRHPASGMTAPDLLLISGGASVGEHDFTRRLLEEAGFTLRVSKTTARPGKPLIVATRGGTLAFGLPGNPLAHFVCLNLYVRAALRVLAGRAPAPLFHAGVLAADLDAGSNARETFWPARWAWRDGVASLTPLRWSSSGDLTALATANALLRVTAGATQLPHGSRVEFTATDEPA
jgi:molybdopterin molybdotransferase